MTEFKEKVGKLEITDKEVAKFLGVSERTVRRWKKGDSTPPKHVLIMLENPHLFTSEGEEIKIC